MNESIRNIASSSLVQNRSNMSKISYMKNTKFGGEGRYMIKQRKLTVIFISEVSQMDLGRLTKGAWATNVPQWGPG